MLSEWRHLIYSVTAANESVKYNTYILLKREDSVWSRVGYVEYGLVLSYLLIYLLME